MLCKLSLMNFIINNQEIVQTNLSIYGINTMNNLHLHTQHTNLSSFQKKYILCWHKNFQQFDASCDNLQE